MGANQSSGKQGAGGRRGTDNRRKIERMELDASTAQIHSAAAASLLHTQRKLMQPNSPEVNHTFMKVIMSLHVCQQFICCPHQPHVFGVHL